MRAIEPDRVRADRARRAHCGATDAPVGDRHGHRRTDALGAGPDRARRRRRGARHGPDAGLPAARDEPARPWFDPYEQHKTPLRRGLARARHRGRRGRRLDGAGRAHHRRTRLQRRRAEHDQRRPPRVRVGARPRRQPAAPTTRRASINGSWDDGEPGRCETEFDSDIAGAARRRHRPRVRRGQLRARLRARARAPPPRRARSPSAASRAPTSSRRSRGAGPRPAEAPLYPTLAAYGEGISIEGPGGSAVVSGTSFAAPQVTRRGRAAGRHVPGRDARCDRRRARARRARRRDAGRRRRHGRRHPQRRPGGRAARRRRPRGPARDDHGALVAGLVAPRARALRSRARARRRDERRRGRRRPSSDCAACPVAPFALTATPLDATRREARGPDRAAARCAASRTAATSLFVRARDAAGNWGPVRQVVLPVDRRGACRARLGGAQRRLVSATLLVRERGLGPRAAALSRRGRRQRPGGWRSLEPAARVRLTLHVTRGPPRDPARAGRGRRGQREPVGVHDPPLKLSRTGS